MKDNVIIIRTIYPGKREKKRKNIKKGLNIMHKSCIIMQSTWYLYRNIHIPAKENAFMVLYYK